MENLTVYELLEQACDLGGVDEISRLLSEAIEYMNDDGGKTEPNELVVVSDDERDGG